MKLSEKTYRKFEEVVSTSDWEVLGEDGFHPITHSNKTVEYEIYEITFSCGRMLECADTHILMAASGEEVYAKDSLGVPVRTQDGISIVTGVTPTGVYENMYDLSVDSEDHTFFTNGILSHNSTTSIGYLLHQMIFNEDMQIGITSYKLANCKDLMGRFKFAYENLPFWLKPPITEYNRYSVKFTNESSIEAQVTRENTFRGNTPKIIFIDELGFVKSSIAEEFWGGLLPSLSAEGENSSVKLIVTSTPNGSGDLFSSIWFGAVAGTNGFYPVKVDYDEIPGRTEKFKKDMIAKFGLLKFQQEFLCVSGDTLVDILDHCGIESDVTVESLYFDQYTRSKNSGCRILGLNGYQKFEKVIKTQHDRYVKITFDDGTNIKCSTNHRFIVGDSPDFWILAEEVETGMVLSGKSVFDAEVIEKSVDLYDVFNTEDHTYYTNGVLSHNCHFLSDKGTLIDSRVLESLESEEPTFYPSEDLYLWTKDLRGKNIAISIDVSEGIGKDYHAMHITDVDEFEQIGEYKNNTMTQTEYVKEIIRVIDLCFKLGAEEVYYTIENNSIGAGVIMLLQNTDSDSLDRAIFISHADYPNKLGMPTNTKTKPHGCQKLKDLVEHGRYKIRSQYLINELKFFVKSKGSFAAESGKHDDLSMAAVLMTLLLEQLSDYEESAYDRMAEVAYDDANDSFEVGIF